MAGRRPKPTALKLITGNPGHRAPAKDEPKPRRASVRPPAGLSDAARKHWRTIAKQLDDAHILTEVDKPALALYCEAYARWCDANAQIQKYGTVVKAPSGFPVQSPYLAIANKAFAQMLKVMAEFGMTPSSRTRVQKVEGDESGANDPWARLKRGAA